MNGRSGQEPNINALWTGPELNHTGSMTHDRDRSSLMSPYKSESTRDMQRPSNTDDEGEVFRDGPATSDVVLRRRFGADESQNENRSKGPHSRRIGLEEQRKEGNAENLGPRRAFQIREARVPSRNRNVGSDVEYLEEDDGEFSVCSENIDSTGDFMSLPCVAASKWSTWERNSKMRRRGRESLLEYLENQRRESVGNRLKELRMPNKRQSVSLLSTSDMPIIAKAKPLKDATLPKQMRRASYQSVIGTPFSAKSGVSITQPQGVGQETDERRCSLMSPRLRTPTSTAWETMSFPLRETESLSSIEHFAGIPKNVLAATVWKRLSLDKKTGKLSDEAMDSKEAPNSSPLSTRQQTQISDHWPEASLENGCSSNYPAQRSELVRHIRQESFSNRNEQIQGPDRPDVAAKSRDTPETERECFAKPVILPRRGAPSSKPDSPNVSREVCSYTAVTDFRPLSIKMMDSKGSYEQLKSVLSTEKAPDDHILNGTCSLKADSPSDKNSDTSSAEICDNNELRSSDSPNLESPTLIETCREDKTTRMKPILSLQTSAKPQKANLPSSLYAEREIEGSATGGFDLDITQPRNVDQRDSAHPIKVPVNPKVSLKYSSNIQIQLKEVEPVFPVSFRQSGKSAACNGGSRDDLPKEGVPTPIDKDDDVDEVAPNWSSYPGPLPDGLRSDEPNDLTTTSKTNEEGQTKVATPGRNVSTLEINLQSASADRREKVSKREVSHTDTYDSSPDPNKSNVRTVLSLKTDVSVDPRPESGFNDPRNCIVGQGETADFDPLDTSRKSVERNEIFLVEDSSSTTARSITLPRDQGSQSWSQLDGPDGVRHLASDKQTRGPGSRQEELDTTATTPKPPIREGIEAVTPDDLCVDVTPSKANVTRITFYSKRDEQRTRSRDGERTCSTYEAIGGISKSGESTWEASVVKRENRWKDSRRSRDSGRSPDKAPSVERIWETLELPRTRLTKRNIRLESDSAVDGSRTEKPQYLPRRHRVASDGGIDEAKVDAVFRSISVQGAPTDPVAESSEGDSLLEIEVQKGGLGLGFCIEGGKDGPYGDRPITVKRLFRGSSDPKFSSASKNSLRAGDEILTANGRDITLLSRFVAWNFLKTLPEGAIKLVIRRRTQQSNSNQLH